MTSPANLARALELWAQADPYVSLPKICRECGISPDRLRALAKEAGLARPARPTAPPAKTQRRVRREALFPNGPFLTSPQRRRIEARAARARRKAQQRMAIIKLWGDGLSIRAISQRLQCDYKTAIAVLTKAGADLSSPRRSFDAAQPGFSNRDATYWWRRT